MSHSYLKVWVDSLEKYRKLNDAEFGRLMRAAIRYKASGEIVKLTGREEILLDGMMTDIDRDTQTDEEKAKARSLAGKKGNEVRWGYRKTSLCDNAIAKHRKHRYEEDQEEEKEEDLPPYSPPKGEPGANTGRKVKAPAPEAKRQRIPYEEIVRHLNEQAGTRYRSTSQKTRDLIRVRFGEGFALEDFIAVIDGRVDKWKTDPKLSEYLRPETLFGTKFESYLNSAAVRPRDEEDSLLKKALKKRAVQVMVV